MGCTEGVSDSKVQGPPQVAWPLVARTGGHRPECDSPLAGVLQDNGSAYERRLAGEVSAIPRTPPAPGEVTLQGQGGLRCQRVENTGKEKT